jgi:hypothetical protein
VTNIGDEQAVELMVERVQCAMTHDQRPRGALYSPNLAEFIFCEVGLPFYGVLRSYKPLMHLAFR